MAPSGPEVFAELILLYAAFLPLGFCLLRLAERALGRTVQLTLVERALLAFYAAGAFLYVLAILPVPWFGLPLVAGLVLIGAAGLVLLQLREGGRGLRRAVRAATRWPVLVVAGMTGLLLGFELVVFGTNALPNTFDGSIQVLFVRLLLGNHTVASTLAPYAQAGVVYPQGTAVWMAAPILLFGWPLTSGPVALPALFLALAVPAAYCWGERLGGVRSAAGERTGVLFAAMFAAVVTWPRFLVVGSYDFVFAVPLFLLAVAWLPTFVRAPTRHWGEVLAFALIVGVAFSLSVAAGEALVLLLVGYLIVLHGNLRREAGQWALRVGLVVGVSGLFLIRSLLGFALWFSYPGHVLTEAGNPPFATYSGGLPFTLGSALGELDPFAPGTPKLSPLPFVQIELAILLAAGLVLIVVRYGTSHTWLTRTLPTGITRPLVVGTVVLLLMTIVLFLATPEDSPLQFLGQLASLEESSILLFVFFQGIAVVPLVCALNYVLTGRSPELRTEDPNAGTTPNYAQSNPRSVRPGGGGRPVVRVLLVAALLFVVTSGVVGTVTVAPPVLHGLSISLANVTQADLDALAWAGDHLPTCSRVLVAPGSAAQFLPAYATLGLVFPMDPAPINLSYSIAVENLTDGNYTIETRTALLELGVTEVFVTGASNVLWKPFQELAMQQSADFQPLFAEGNASILAFLPGSYAHGCPEDTIPRG